MKKSGETKGADVFYEPCSVGIHVCGPDPVYDAAMTYLNAPTDTVEAARALFAAVKAECEATADEPRDFVVDLNIGRDELHVEDFYITRQMLSRIPLIAAKLPEGGA